MLNHVNILVEFTPLILISVAQEAHIYQSVCHFVLYIFGFQFLRFKHRGELSCDAF